MSTLKEGTYIDTSVEEYRKWPGINYSSLANFAESQDHALMEIPAKSYFEEGNAFELLIEDSAKGTNKFGERFFIAEAPGTMPDDLAGWIERGESLNEKYRVNKDGSLNKGSKRLHAWLDECQKNPGKMPVGKDRMEMLNKMVENFMVMQPFSDIGTENTMAEILPVSYFQVPIIWYVGKMMKKALIDFIVDTGKTIYAFDIKTAADIERFVWMLKKKYFIQECHYSVGLGQVFPGKKIIWRFAVSSKAAPYLSQPFSIDPYTLIDKCMPRYQELCRKYDAWVKDGKPPKGWKEHKHINVYLD